MLLDHLVYAVPDLEAALDWFETKTGLRPAIGGRHPDRGTRNAVINLGQKAYLEIVAVDPDNSDVPPPRWMGVDHITTPTMTRWAVKSPNLAADARRLSMLRTDLARTAKGQRQLPDGATLSWQMSLPAPEPAVELIPFFLDWSSSSFHPTDRMASGYSLEKMEFFHPDAGVLQANFDSLDLRAVVQLGGIPSIVAHLNTPKGKLVI